MTEPASRTQPELSVAEREFAIAAGVSSDAFTGESAEINAQWQAASAAWVEAEKSSWLTTVEVAKLLNVTVAEVRRLRARGDLTAGRAGREFAYPNWQFTSGGRFLPGLRVLLSAFPPDYDPLDIAAFMTTSTEDLDAASPKEWLESGGDAHRLVHLIGDLSWA
ncbi:helix-turn-helix domain-containing protein [Microbacterium terricola]|uniref:Helix-turn-helix domain-containing protein n=1 Tax=Microbacterium terricola TaxID=344163 RepID=A0ABM8E2P5_9MICO|nr:helix-turn-helix domain-containing protein [Microbacterium terricola]UYK40059.1 helix-turn-helix domain-containing protein [Microbacterium terricola]BDV32244.1 hypothetical protein Microterr_29040 [Microbacterium terricola]